jgi:hypothetical protein
MNSEDTATRTFGGLFDNPNYARTLDQINRSPTLQQDIIEFATGTGRFAGRTPGNFTTADISPGGGEYRSQTNTLAIGERRLQGLNIDQTINPVADAGPAIAHEIQHAFDRATINRLSTTPDPGFRDSISPNIVWNNLLDEGEAQLRQYHVAKEIYNGEVLNYEVDPSASQPILRMDATRAANIEQWLADGNELYRHGLIPSVDYLARANLAVDIGNNAGPSNSDARNYVDYYASNGAPSADNSQRLQHVEITGMANGKLSVVFSTSGADDPVVHLTQPIAADGQGVWNAEICRLIPPGQTGNSPAPMVVIDGQPMTVVKTVSSDGQGETSVTEFGDDGGVDTRIYDPDGGMTREWKESDGSHGKSNSDNLGNTESENYYADGSRKRTVEHADGTVEEWIYDENGEIYVSPDYSLMDRILPEVESLPSDLNLFFISARDLVVRVDPLVLDLDGDNLELTAASGNILFDHNADTIKTGTGWVKPDDGFLVRDVNQNGVIDTGRELFGVDTLKKNGALASQGFDALADLDSNQDLQITAADADFNGLMAWQDENQDGISQSGELKTLTQLGITRIGLNGSAKGPQAGQVINNNLVALSTTFTRDGQTRTVGAIDLEENNFFTEFASQLVDESGTVVAISERAKALPQMKGSGMVRNLRAAASLSGSLADALQTFAATTTRDGQYAQIDGLITQWANTSSYASGGLLSGNTVNITFALQGGITADQFSNMVNVLEAFNGSRFYGNELGGPRPQGFEVHSYFDAATQTKQYQYYIRPQPQQLARLQQAYDALKTSVYDALMLQTRLKPYVDSITVQLDKTGIHLDPAALAGRLDAAQPRDAVLDLADLYHLARPLLQAAGFDTLAHLSRYIDALPADALLQAELSSHGIFTQDGNHFIEASYKLERIEFSSGNPLLLADLDAAPYRGTAGADAITGAGGSELFIGGKGADTISSGEGSATYQWAQGDGNDVLSDYDWESGNIDTLKLTDVAAGGVMLSRDVSHLYITVTATGEKIQVSNHFMDAAYKLERIEFSSGNPLLLADLDAAPYRGTVGADTITGAGGSELFIGGKGVDIISSGEGNHQRNRHPEPDPDSRPHAGRCRRPGHRALPVAGRRCGDCRGHRQYLHAGPGPGRPGHQRQGQLHRRLRHGGKCEQRRHGQSRQCQRCTHRHGDDQRHGRAKPGLDGKQHPGRCGRAGHCCLPVVRRWCGDCQCQGGFIDPGAGPGRQGDQRHGLLQGRLGYCRSRQFRGHGAGCQRQ